jgi:hypothetical protein
MKVLTKRASEQVVIDKPVRLVVLNTAPDKVKLGVLDTDEGVEESRREPSPDSDRRTEMGVKIVAPYGEEIEIDG